MIQPVVTQQPILVVEDSDDDYDALQRAMLGTRCAAASVHRCENGQDALDFLFRRNVCRSASTNTQPSLILLDLNMPGIGGRKVLAEVKGAPTLKRVPVIVMTTSDDERDIADCYELGANTYIKKPMTGLRFSYVVRQLSEYWLEIAELPNG